ncbi:MAG: hypothetical protein KDB37_00985 [Ilumatobacter sp.]|nr:hypothetical protein [Ilumatobacter sp.]
MSPADTTTDDATFDRVELKEPTSADAVIYNTRALAGLIAEEADAIEEVAKLTDRAALAMRRAGVFEMGFPASRGGLEMTLEQQVQVVAEIAAVDASAGWNVGVLNAGGFYAGRLSEQTFAELYPTTDRPTSGSFHPRGRAVQTDGGYLVSGHWDWGSGSYTADHVVGGCLVFDADGAEVIGSNGQQMLIGAWLPPEAIEPLDNWQTLGVCGSGSTSYRITEPAFVPVEHTFDREAPFDPDADPLNKTVTACHYALSGVVLGIARHAVNLAGEAVRVKGSARGPDSATLQMLGQAIGEVDFAYSGVREIARMSDEILFTDGAVMTPWQQARMTAANATAANALRRVLPVCTELAGSRHIMDDHPMQRVLRDGNSALAHAGAKQMLFAFHAQALVDDSTTGFTIGDDPVDAGFRSMRRWSV